MTARDETHARVKEIFLEAAARPRSERETFLRDACGDDAELRREVETLLAHHHPESIVESTPASGRRVLRPSSLSPTPPGGRFPGRRLAASLVATVLFVWLGVGHRQSRLERVAGDSRLAPLVRELLEIERAGGSDEDLRTSRAHGELAAILVSYWSRVSDEDEAVTRLVLEIDK